jgi:NAD(P)-dependent dehydrogenase (short-subunit alcohol dehydrogenase family)
MGRLSGKIAIVTGAARGLGRAIALRFAEEGCALSVLDIAYDDVFETASLAQQAGAEAIPFQTDVTKRTEVESMVAETERRLGTPHILVNNAGIFFNASIDTMTEEQWNRMINTNLSSVFLVSQVVIQRWLGAKQAGVIVNLSSMVNNMAFTNSSHYIASKSGVYGFTRATALEFAGRGIRANAIAPGIIDTELNRPAMSNPDTLADWMRHIPFNRVGRPEEIANAALFLASDESSYITGQLLIVDGGWLLE